MLQQYTEKLEIIRKMLNNVDQMLKENYCIQNLSKVTRNVTTRSCESVTIGLISTKINIRLIWNLVSTIMLAIGQQMLKIGQPINLLSSLMPKRSQVILWDVRNNLNTFVKFDILTQMMNNIKECGLVNI